ncbi:uncharacterized protein GGS22DRAFT_169618 [Annulohypoxylon maeteangense]|uniref:uncharacterized protein n=1 Tax=Annulohypoxylon maeteangense TaxID=1927788 RepID=UPI0020072BA5|nr:uncharacterized protein GGS22DRAFT_169618 [Annulohypoxylon maeteangense]KAI0882506.1 hypothetical protein GGS22DRAFT_169618 [Annulohypoxylon maeteangense]
MAPELRKRKAKEVAVSVAKPATKGKADAPATKRKAADDASPVAAKKSKPVKDDSRSKKVKANRSTETKPPKSSRSAKVNKKDEETVESEDGDAQSSDDEKDNAKALAKIVDSDDEDAVVDTDAAFKEGQDVGEIPKESKELLKSSKSGDDEHGVVYIGRLPHGFYEHEMRSYFCQFGTIERIRMSRNKKTGASRHFAFIEFTEASVAEVVAKTMDNYLLFGRILKVKVVPKSQVHEDLWKGSNRRFKKVPWNKMAGNNLKKPLSESTWTQKITKEEQKRAERAKKLQDIGYDFEGPKIKSVDEVEKDAHAIEGAEDEAPKAIEAAPEDVAMEEEVKDDSNDVPAVKEPATISKQGAAKSSKKGKKSKAKKATA